MGNTNFPIKGKSCYVTRTGTGFRFPGAAGGKTGTEFRFPGDAEDKPEPSSGSRELPEAKPEPGSGSRELPKINRNRVPVPASCRR